MNILNQYDHALMLWLNYDGGSMLDAFWYAVSYKFTWIPLYVAILVAMVRGVRQMLVSDTATSNGQASLRRELFIVLIVTVLIIVAADQISSGLIKPLVQRLRPSHDPRLMADLHFVNDYHGGRYGFVSSHAANTLALALWVSLLFRRTSVWCAMLTFYVVNCYSRIYLGVHFPGDIVGGSVVGAICASLGYLLYKKVSRFSFSQSQALRPTALPIPLIVWASLAILLGYAMAVGL